MYGLGDIDFQALDQTQPMHPSLQQEARRVIKLAEAGTVAITVLQAVAAFSALTLAIIAWRNYADSRKQHRSRRHTVKLNGQRRKK